MQLGPYTLNNNLILAPMAGVTDRPFRQLCRELGAGMAVSEMVSANTQLWATKKTQRRIDHTGETLPRSVQIAGTDPEVMAIAAQMNVDSGAQLIDINMGCPARKVCNVFAGSALMQDEDKVARILEAVVNAVDVPVTLKMRTGWDQQHRNAPAIARLAQQSGIQSLAIHGRTRADAYRGNAEYNTIAQIVNEVNIPVIANGDINSAEKAKQVLTQTGAAAIMIGRAAQGNPWIFREINHYLKTGEKLAGPDAREIKSVWIRHLENLYDFYGEYTGVRVARKHIAWYSKGYKGGAEFRKYAYTLEDCKTQLAAVSNFIDQQEAIAA